MATREDIYAAMRNADAAGDAESVKKLAGYLQTMGDAPQAPEKPKTGIQTITENLNKPSTGLNDSFLKGTAKVGLGVLRGAADVGNTLTDAAINGGEYIKNKLTGDTDPSAIKSWNDKRNADLKGADQQLSDAGGPLYGVSRLGGNVLSTLPVGGLLAGGAKALGAGEGVVNALATGGMRAGGNAGAYGNAGQVALNALQNAGSRVLGGGTTALVSTAAVSPENALTGGVIGAAAPGVVKLAGMGGSALAKGITGGVVSDNVAALAKRAKELGIDIPADRIANSRVMNKVASALDYVPLSGRPATEATMHEQMKTALSRTMGQEDPNLAVAYRKAKEQLGGSFEATLKTTPVAVDKTLLDGLAKVGNEADAVMVGDSLASINKQINNIMTKAKTGEIDGQAAYNIKKDLDRLINSSDSTLSYHAKQLQMVLMDGLNRSLGPAEAAKFAKVRQQYGNMLDIEPMIKNGAEGDISIARLANLRDIHNPDMKELADIASQFVKTRESAHGGAQTALGTMAALGSVGSMGALSAGGRATNAALNSNLLKKALLGENKLLTRPLLPDELSHPGVRALLNQTAADTPASMRR